MENQDPSELVETEMDDNSTVDGTEFGYPTQPESLIHYIDDLAEQMRSARKQVHAAENDLLNIRSALSEMDIGIDDLRRLAQRQEERSRQLMERLLNPATAFNQGSNSQFRTQPVTPERPLLVASTARSPLGVRDTETADAIDCFENLQVHHPLSSLRLKQFLDEVKNKHRIDDIIRTYTDDKSGLVDQLKCLRGMLLLRKSQRRGSGIPMSNFDSRLLFRLEKIFNTLSSQTQ